MAQSLFRRLAAWCGFPVRRDDSVAAHVAQGPGLWLDTASAAPLPDRAPDWLLFQDGRTIGHLLSDDEASDFPWLVCHFTPLPGFAAVAELFAEQRSLLKDRRYEAAEAVEDRLAAGGVVLRRADDMQTGMALQIEGGRAWFRVRPRGS